MTVEQFDYIVIGAGIYGLYAANVLSNRGLRVAVMEYDEQSFQRASYINQARVHNGYHYPRSYSTAKKSADYFERFCRDFDFAIHNRFRKIYAIASRYSLSNAEQFVKFCQATGIPVAEIKPETYFQPNTVEGVYQTLEYAFDAFKIRDFLLEGIAKHPKTKMLYSTRIQQVEEKGANYCLTLADGKQLSAGVVLNATYASVNQLLSLFGMEKFKIKYEICEITLCRVNSLIQEVGLTVMDGPFFSVMPFGLGGLHSLTAVTFTPHLTSYEALPTFPCQQQNTKCTPRQLANCNLCPARPNTAWDYMRQLSRKYLNDKIEMEFCEALFAIKPIPNASELDDSRPTIIKTYHENPTFTTVLSGKINTMYDLEGVLS